MSADQIGGRKSEAHIYGQNRLEKIFKWTHNTKKEDEVIAVDGKTYFVDVMIYAKWSSRDDPFKVAALEVDTYVYGSQKKKSPKHIQQRDEAIMRTIERPVIRIDVDALKEGRRKTKFYMNDGEIQSYVYNKITAFWSNPEQYIKEAQRG
jgi:hypothetical protein